MKKNEVSKEQAIEMIKSNLEQSNSIPMIDEGSGADGGHLVNADGQEEVDEIVDELKKKEFSMVDVNNNNFVKNMLEQLNLTSTPEDYEYCVCFANKDDNYKQYFLIWE